MACSCCAFGNTADEHFNADKVAKELAQYRRILSLELLDAGLSRAVLLRLHPRTWLRPPKRPRAVAAPA